MFGEGKKRELAKGGERGASREKTFLGRERKGGLKEGVERVIWGRNGLGIFWRFFYFLNVILRVNTENSYS